MSEYFALSAAAAHVPCAGAISEMFVQAKLKSFMKVQARNSCWKYLAVFTGHEGSEGCFQGLRCLSAGVRMAI